MEGTELARSGSDFSKLSNEVVVNEETRKKKIVLDTSVVGTYEINMILEEAKREEIKVVLTTVTIRELKKLRDNDDEQGRDAKFISGEAARDIQGYEEVLIDENGESPDDCIIRYCEENKENVILYSADVEMVLLARAHHIEVYILTKIPNKTNNVQKLVTLAQLRPINDGIYITEYKNSNQLICIYRGDLKFTDGARRLMLNDDIFIANKAVGYFSFTHWQVVNENAENNCRRVYYKRFYNYQELEFPEELTKKALYMDFMKNFRKLYKV